MTKSDIESGPDDRGDNGSSLRELSESIEAMVKTLEPPLSSNCCIYRVPKKLRELNEAAYTPHLVSIGPFHNGKEGLQTMEKHKVRYMNKILQLPGVRLEDLVSYIKGCEDKVRCYYAEAIVLKDNDFLKMVLLDGCFIIKYFRMNYYEDTEVDENDKILQTSLFRNDIIGDLFLLENQLPFFLLEGLYNIAFPTASNPPPVSFLELSCHVFSLFNKQEKSMKEAEEVKHFTDLLRTFILPTPTQKKVKEVKQFTGLHILPKLHCPKSATELQEAGVKFKLVKSSKSKCLFEIQFSGGKLKIPVLKFDDGTESYFRNIMALEQCHPYSEIASLSSYIILMDSLIDTSKDVDLLVRANIIENWLGDNHQVVTLVNRLCKEIVAPSSFYYHKQCKGLNEYCKKPCHRWMATYCLTPCRIATTIAAALALLLTLHANRGML